MSRSILVHLAVVGLLLLLLAVFAPVVVAQSGPSGTYNVTFYNYVSDEGGAGCPAGGMSAGTEGAANTFHFWAEGAAPYSGATVNNYTVCWDGWLTFPQSGSWNVQTLNDDGMDIWVDGQITMQAWYDQGPSQHTGTISLDSSAAHHVIIKYYNRNLAGTACVGWGLSGSGIANWNCPSAQTTYYATPVPTPVYAPPPYVPPYGLPPGGQGTTVVLVPCTWCYVPILGQQYAVPYAQPYVRQPYTPRTLPASYCTYRVRPGDTLIGIALKYRTSIWALAQVNRLSNPSLIYAGAILYIPNCQ
jgi:hypothetical protein